MWVILSDVNLLEEKDDGLCFLNTVVRTVDRNRDVKEMDRKK